MAATNPSWNASTVVNQWMRLDIAICTRPPAVLQLHVPCTAFLYSGERLADIAQKEYNNPRTL